ncbi:MAG: hypothetical protein BI182_02405 [Acetobacterium sp. MES1]|uniref:Virulence-associated protein E-like domain-containing protein n=1 Tax=Acetobacterium wieringae TaxID=52694 RepID=A0A5D0WRW1_9FIRM|nr:MULTISPECIES: virulence-associated E family protein [Acetobacterium]OXS26580.1 MAG: hypothetical protein BI182_02405 [Acetobacterium sp. MES1]TYC86491.1 hypothetical protein FXB42_06430 [Acetobacterium wieringae]
MRELPIAYGNSCYAKKWSNKKITFDDLCQRLEHTVRTPETVEEYPKLPKTERDRTKDKGGFVGGSLKNGSRKRDSVVCRSMLTHDADHADKDFIERFEMLCKYTACLYTTHGHIPEAPRIRIIIPMTRDVTPDEYTAIARYFAAEWNMDCFDECSYRPHQLMYWPTTPSNGEYIFKRIDGEWLDPDSFLSAHPNWRDCSLLPTSSRESQASDHKKLRQQDPLEKAGVVGAFCRAYSIQEAIETFLSDVYEASVLPGRYDYIPADSSAGVVVYDGKFAYSHHSTDPACEKELNAFDLVRVHKFCDVDEKKSFSLMAEFAVSDDAVKSELSKAREALLEEDFADTDDWTTRLKYQPKSSVLDNSVWNEVLILNNDPDFSNFAFNEMANRIQITGAVPWDRPSGNPFWRDADTAQLKALIDVRYVSFSSRNHDVSFVKVADDRHFHPIRDYLDKLPEWDGTKRLENLLIRYFDAADTPYIRAVTRKTFAGAVARIYKPGTKFDCIPVLDGDQGIGKSTFFKDLAGEEYYSDTLSLTDMNDKSGAEKLQGFWIVEIGELAGMKKADIERVKAFLSTTDDKYRPSYGRTVESHPRQCIIIASVNRERGYLRDITGNRRFWVVKCNRKEQIKTWNFSEVERDQIWSEAKHYYQSGEKLFLEGEMLRASEEAQRDAMEVDERQGMVEEYLDTLLPESWESMDAYARRNYLAETNAPTSPLGTVERTTVSNAEIWCECYGRSLSDLKPSDSYAIAALMAKVDGWVKTGKVRKRPIYGKQRLYERSCCQLENADK